MSNFEFLLPNPIDADNVNVSTTGEYVMPCFGNTEQRLRFLTSKDLVNYVQSGGIVYSPSSGDLRDPDMYYSSTNNLYYIAYTAGVFGQANFFNIISSPDLRNWSVVTSVSVTSVGTVLLTWSPIWFTDPSDGSLHIIVSCATTTATATQPTNMQPYELHPTNAAMTAWSNPVLITGAGKPVNMIATRMVIKSGTYYLWYQNLGTVVPYNTILEILSSSTPFTNYVSYKSGNWAGWGAAAPAGAGGFEAGGLVESPSGTWTLLGQGDLGIQKTVSTDDWSTWTTRAYISSPIPNGNTSCAFLAKNVTNVTDAQGYDINSLLAPYINQTIPAVTSTRETTFKLSVSDAPLDTFFITNATSVDGRFIPAISGFVNTVAGTCLAFNAYATAANDTGTSAGIQFSFRRTNSTTDPANGTFSDISTRPLIQIFNNNTEAFAVAANGDVKASTGNLQTATIGKTLQIKSGTNAKAGTFTLVAGAATVANTSVTANSVIVVTLKTLGGTRAGNPDIVPTATTGFVATGAATDTSV